MKWRTGVFVAVGLLVTGLLIGWQLSPRVIGVLPPEGGLQGRQPLTIQFNREMNASSVEDRVEIIPDFQGDFTWDAATKELTFTPETIWPSGDTVTIRLNSGIRSRLRIPIWQAFTFEWQVNTSSLVYLWPADGKSNLYQINPDSGNNQILTDHTNGVLDYSISPQQDQILYSMVEDDGRSTIMALDLQSGETAPVIDCPDALCVLPQLSFDGTLLAHEVISRESGSLPTIRIVDLGDQTEQDLGEGDEYLESPLWSSTGWLVYYNRTAKGYIFWDPATDQTRFLPNETGGYGTWSADGRYFLTSEILFAGETLAPRHLQLFDVAEDLLQDLTEGDFLEDLNPSFSPVDLRFAFSRKSLNPQEWTLGRQLWIMDLESGQSKPLTDEDDYQHTSFAWHPDGEQLTYVRYNQARLSESPEIWLINAITGDGVRLIINGFAPGWIP